jgi:hypothetical protein
MAAPKGSLEPTLAKRLADCLMYCGDLLQLATHRLLRRGAATRRCGCLNQVPESMASVVQASLQPLAPSRRWERLKERCEHHLPVLYQAEAGGKCQRFQSNAWKVQFCVISKTQPSALQALVATTCNCCACHACRHEPLWNGRCYQGRQCR